MMELVATNLTLAYKRQAVVHNLSLAVSGGSVLGLIGPNGSGKTTVLRALVGLSRPRCGSVSLDGRDVSRIIAAERARQIGFVPQGETHAWALTVQEMVLLGRAPHRGWLLPFSAADHAAVECALSQMGLLSLRDRPIDKLSGGERQRTLIARALAQEPKVLLLDEPTANLDLRYQIQILDLVSRLAADHQLAVVVAIHDLTLAARYCDCLMLLRTGQVHACGAPDIVLTPENLQAVFGIDAELYHDPRGQWTISASSEQSH
jgi:iron complex transport system ATP-binding protein